MRFVLFVTLLAITALPASAEPTGRWFSGYGQGTMEYGIKNDSAGSDYFYIACPEDGATINFTVGGKNPEPHSVVIVVIGADEYELFTGKTGEFRTTSHVGYDNFRSLWTSMRKGQTMRVRLSTGESTAFTLRGAAAALPREHCKTSFELPILAEY